MGVPNTISWRVLDASADMASFRYRVGIPSLHLRPLGYRSRILSLGAWTRLQRKDAALVLSKMFIAEDLPLVRRARQLGVPVFLDLCDNIFAAGYDTTFTSPAVFVEMAQHARAVVVTGPALQAVARTHVQTPVEMIADPEETERDSKELVHIAEGTRRHQLGLLRWVTGRKLAQHGLRWLPGAVLRVMLRGPHHFIPPAPRRGEPSPKAVVKKSGGRRVVWFGNHAGLSGLAKVAEELRAVNARIPITLVVITNNPEVVDRLFRRAPFPYEYIEWNVLRVHHDLAACDVALLPSIQDEFGLAKSANRVVTALAHGLPVVTSSSSAADPFRACVVFDDWERGLHMYLSQPEVAREHVFTGRQIIAEQFSGKAVARAWAELFRKARA